MVAEVVVGVGDQHREDDASPHLLEFVDGVVGVILDHIGDLLVATLNSFAGPQRRLGTEVAVPTPRARSRATFSRAMSFRVSWAALGKADQTLQVGRVSRVRLVPRREVHQLR